MLPAWKAWRWAAGEESRWRSVVGWGDEAAGALWRYIALCMLLEWSAHVLAVETGRVGLAGYVLLVEAWRWRARAGTGG